MDRRLLAILSFGHFATDLAQGAMPALLPVFKSLYQLSYAGVGFIVLMASLSSSIVQPVFGMASDRLRVRWLMPAGIFVAGMGMALAVLMPHYALMIAMVFLSGLGVAAFHPEGYRYAGLASGERRATGMSYFSVGGNAGIGLGPLAASLAIGLAHVYGMTYIMLFSIPAAVLLWRATGRRRMDRLEMAWRASPSPAGVSAAGRQRASASVGILILLVMFVIMRSWVSTGTSSFIPLFFTGVKNLDPRYAGAIVSAFLVCGAIGTLLGGPIADLWGRRRMLILSMALLTPLLWLLPRATGAWTLLVAALAGMASVSTFAVVIVMAQELFPLRMGMTTGLIIGFGVGMGGVGVTLLGAIADRWGLPRAMDTTALLPLAALAIALRLPPDRPRGNLPGEDERTSVRAVEARI